MNSYNLSSIRQLSCAKLILPSLLGILIGAKLGQASQWHDKAFPEELSAKEKARQRNAEWEKDAYAKDQEEDEWKRIRDEIRGGLELRAQRFQNDPIGLLHEFCPKAVKGLSPSHTEKQLDKAFKKALKCFHPDKTARMSLLDRVEAEEIFKILSNEKEQPLRARKDKISQRQAKEDLEKAMQESIRLQKEREAAEEEMLRAAIQESERLAKEQRDREEAELARYKKAADQKRMEREAEERRERKLEARRRREAAEKQAEAQNLINQAYEVSEKISTYSTRNVSQRLRRYIKRAQGMVRRLETTVEDFMTQSAAAQGCDSKPLDVAGLKLAVQEALECYEQLRRIQQKEEAHIAAAPLGRSPDRSAASPNYKKPLLSGSQAPKSAIANPTEEILWHCLSCGMHNDRSEESCRTCGNPQN